MESQDANHELADMVHTARTGLGMSQEELAETMGKSRFWVMRMERGLHRSGAPFDLDGDMALKLASVLNLNPVSTLRAGRVPASRWPNMSHIDSNDGSVKSLDVSSLTSEQRDMIERVVNELKRLNQQAP